jgi:hypothetical protein
MLRTPIIKDALLAAVLVLAGLALGAVSAEAHWERSEYSYSAGCGSGDHVDPIGVVFFGSAGHIFPVRRDVAKHTGWNSYPLQGNQFIRDHGGCRGVDAQLASNHGIPLSRFHVRLWQKVHPDQKGRWETVGTPHHEDWVQSCKGGRGGHAIDKGAVDRGQEWRTRTGSGFDWGRRTLVEDYRGSRHHQVSNAYWGNTASKKQCDGDYAGSNGNVAWVSVGLR